MQDAHFITSILISLSIGFLIVKLRICKSSEEKSFELCIEDEDIEVPVAARFGWRSPLRQTHSIEDFVGTDKIPCHCPSTGDFLGFVQAHTKKSLDNVVKRGVAAQQEWRKTSFAERKRWLKTLLVYILDHQEEIAAVASRDTGKTSIDALLGEILVTVEKIRWILEHGEKCLRPSSRSTNLLMIYKKNYVQYEPLGLVLACVSWNYPFHNCLSPIIASVFCGNSIIVKASEQTAWSSLFFEKIVSKSLMDCNFDKDIAQIVSCWPEDAEYLLTKQEIKHVTFIGSYEVGRKVARNVADRLCPTCMELGGKDAAIILDDLNPSQLNNVCSILMRGVFQSAGQNCIGIERIIVLPNIYNEIIEILEDRIMKLRVGPPLNYKDIDVGSMISHTRFDNLEYLIQDAVENGAQLLVGGFRLDVQNYSKGSYFSPTLLTNVTRDMRIANAELFAPIALVMKAEDIDEAIQISNCTKYGLGASVFGNSKLNINKCINEIKSGMISVNDFGSYYMTQLPFGGVEGSGYGRFAGKEGLRSICIQKSICQDRFRIIKTSIPTVVDYPIENIIKAWEFLHGLIIFIYSPSITNRIYGLKSLILNSN